MMQVPLPKIDWKTKNTEEPAQPQILYSWFSKNIGGMEHPCLRVTFCGNKDGELPALAVIIEVEKRLRVIGLDFKAGFSALGRDWWFDTSLAGSHYARTWIGREIDDRVLRVNVPIGEADVRYCWHTDLHGHPSVLITFFAGFFQAFNFLIDSEMLMGNIGFTFDTGFGTEGKGNCRACRDWEFDWSLRGRHYLQNPKTRRFEQISRGRER